MTSSLNFEVYRSDHVGISVPSLDDAILFWTEALGAELIRTGEMAGDFLAQVTGAKNSTVKMAIVELAGQKIELLEYDDVTKRTEAPSKPYSAGILHLAIQVSNIEAVIEKVGYYGWKAQGKPQKIEAGSRAGTHVMYIVGPSGTALELMQPPSLDK